jgi:DNA-binding transcriptional LysR family regulator
MIEYMVELTMQVENTHVIENRLIAGEIDIGFAEGIVGSELLEYHVFANDELVLIAEPKHPLTRQAPVPLSTVMQYPIVMHEVGSGTRAVTERAFATKKLAIRPAMSLASTEAIKQTVATGAGIAVLSAFAIRTEVAAKTLAVVPVKGLNIQRPLYRVQLKSSWASPALTAFVNLLDG